MRIITVMMLCYPLYDDGAGPRLRPLPVVVDLGEGGAGPVLDLAAAAELTTELKSC